ncbi:MAG: DEAD/DEAH box helicase [Synergistaceae bacterium]|nr:DEAD/DEAH box helicase [Synergistaceae bacterium]
MINGLRDYQRKAIEDTYAWMGSHPGNPCIVAPTGSGKSWICAGLCEDIISRDEKNRIVVLSHVQELLTQDAEKIRLAWPEAPVGIYSAGLGQREIDRITVAGIQSIWRKTWTLGKVSLAIVDEAHTIGTKDSGMYRTFLRELKDRNPDMRVIGLTATPYRLGQGMITEGEDRLFDGLIESVSIDELVSRGYLAPLRSKLTDLTLNVSGVKKRLGEFVGDELQKRVDTKYNNEQIVSETIRRAERRQAWLVFATGVEHALHLRDEFRQQGIDAETVTGETPKEERARILESFKAGRIKAVTNMGVLTTGFDYPNIDLIVMARPTMSPGLYAQIAGRGMRVKTGPYKDCLVLDFAGNIARHGPITAIQPPNAKKDESGLAPVKKCPECQEAVMAHMKVCPCCGHVFQPPEPQVMDFTLNETEDIMGGATRMAVKSWIWRVVRSRKGDIPMIRVDFLGENFLDPDVSLYLCLMHGGYATQKARRTLEALTSQKAPKDISEKWLYSIARYVTSIRTHPTWIEYRRRGRYYDVTQWGWEEAG